VGGALINFFSFLCVGEFKQVFGLVFLGNLQYKFYLQPARKKKEKQGLLTLTYSFFSLSAIPQVQSCCCKAL
jgi:hypothetical protein